MTDDSKVPAWVATAIKRFTAGQIAVDLGSNLRYPSEWVKTILQVGDELRKSWEPDAAKLIGDVGSRVRHFKRQDNLSKHGVNLVMMYMEPMAQHAFESKLIAAGVPARVAAGAKIHLKLVSMQA